MTPTFLVGGLYRHYKGNCYWVLGLAQHTETDELLVAYVPLYDYGLPGPRLRVRPLAMFIEPVVWPDGLRRPRFLEGQEIDKRPSGAYLDAAHAAIEAVAAKEVATR